MKSLKQLAIPASVSNILDITLDDGQNSMLGELNILLDHSSTCRLNLIYICVRTESSSISRIHLSASLGGPQLPWLSTVLSL